ncbi:MAG: hypothetical protein ACOC8F_04800 [Planctomycetota bacterium]
MDPESPTDRRNTSDTRYLVIVSILLALIIVSLAALWLIERNRRIGAQRRLAEARTQTKQQLASFLERQLAGPAAQGGVAPLAPADIVELTARNGRRRLRIDADAGRRLGFRPGDVVEVAPRAATRPVRGRTPPATP